MSAIATTYRGHTIQTARSTSDAAAVRVYIYRGATAEVVAVIDVRGTDAVTVARRWLDTVYGPSQDALAATVAALLAVYGLFKARAQERRDAERRATYSAALRREQEREISELMRERADNAARNQLRYGDNRPVSTPERASRLLGY